MVLKISNQVSYDLFNLADNYGLEDDRIFVLASLNNRYSTYSGNDIIDATTASATAFITEMSTGTGDDQIYGSKGDDWAFDGAGNDLVLLGNGNDRMHVDTGNDTYAGGTGVDMVDFRYINFVGLNAAAGADTNTAGVTFDLAVTTQNLGILGTDTFYGFEDINGSSGADKLSGNSVANTITGDKGNDVIDGRGGNDNMMGQEGGDFIYGGQGSDTINLSELTAKRDFAVFTALSDSGLTAAAWDTIVSFDKGGLATDDKIILTAIDANPLLAGNQDFTFRGSAAFTAAAGEVRLVVSGADTFIHIDTDADAAAEMIIKVQGVTGLAITDFVL